MSFRPPRDKIKEELIRLRKLVRKTEVNESIKNKNDFSELLESFDKQIEELYILSENSIKNSATDDATKKSTKKEIVASSNLVNSLRKTCKEMEYRFPTVESIEAYRKIKNNLSKLNGVCNFMGDDMLHYSIIGLGSVLELISLVGLTMTYSRPEYAMMSGVLAGIFGICIFPAFNYYAITSFQRSRYVEASREIYNIHDIFLNEAKKTYRVQ